MSGDLKYAWRQLTRSPGFSVTAVVTLALGIGATTAIFTLFDQVLLRALPVEKPQELVRMDWHGSFAGAMNAFGGDVGNYYSYPMYRDLRDRNEVFTGMLAATRANVGVAWHNQAADVDAEIVSGNYFQVLGLQPVAGRLLTSRDETQKDADAVVVLSYDFWRSQFGAQRDVIGQTLRIGGHPFKILGVAPESFQTAIGGYRPRLFVPVTMVDDVVPAAAPGDPLDNRLNIWLTIVARRKPGVTIAQAEASILPLWRALRAQELPLYKSASKQFGERYVAKAEIRVLDDSRGFSPNRLELKMPLVILLSMSALLLAICGLNVAILLLLRSAARLREMSMRYALGAKSGRIVRQLLVEGGLLGVAGVACGLALSPILARILVQLMMHFSTGSEPYSTHLDGRVLLFAVGITFVVSLLFSITPALHYLRPDLAEALRQNMGTDSKKTQILRKVAVGAEIAISVLLLGFAGLFVRTLDHLRDQPVGFDTRHTAIFSLNPSDSGYGEERTPQILMATLEAVRRIPGTTAVAATSDPELMGSQDWNGFVVQGHDFGQGEQNAFESPYVTPGYFATIGQPLLIGRDFTSADTKGAERVAIVNLAFAKKFYGSAQNALGRLIGEDSGNGAKADTMIVGVVGDVKHFDLRTEMGPGVYQPYLQEPHPSGLQIYVRMAQYPEGAEAAIRNTIHTLDPVLVVDGLRTMETQVDISAANERALAMLALGFAILAALLATVGLYGVLAYSAQSRTREIGIRLALGSPRSRVVGLVVREMAWITGTALVVALPGTVGLAHFFASQLYGVSAWDPVSAVIAVVLTSAMVALASALPARRAASVQPIKALRAE
jgi:putative ABC transport system permease protein